MDAEKCYFLCATDVIEAKNIHFALENKISQITGQNLPSKLSGPESIDFLCNCFENVIAQMPGYIYWKDINYRYVFCNNAVAYNLGFKSPNEIRGKTDYEFGWDKKLVDKYRQLDE